MTSGQLNNVYVFYKVKSAVIGVVWSEILFTIPGRSLIDCLLSLPVAWSSKGLFVSQAIVQLCELKKLFLN